jgi:hypothetical protein
MNRHAKDCTKKAQAEINHRADNMRLTEKGNNADVIASSLPV